MTDDNLDLIQFSRNQEAEANTRFSTPTKRRKMNSQIAQYMRLLIVTQQPTLQILDSGAGNSGVGQQWEMTDIEKASDVTIQGAFGEPMQPSVQGLLGPDKLQAVLVLDTEDDIYSLCQLLQPTQRSGSQSRIAVFPENRATIMTSESCQVLIEKAIQQGALTHVADQVKGIYILFQKSTNITTLSKNKSPASALDDLFTGYTRHGLN